LESHRLTSFQNLGLAGPITRALAEKEHLHIKAMPALRVIQDMTSAALHFQMVVSNRAAPVRRIADRLE
jgi:hypothetical protein